MAWVRSARHRPAEMSAPVEELEDGIVSGPVPVQAVPRRDGTPIELSAPSASRSDLKAVLSGAIANPSPHRTWAQQFESPSKPLTDESVLRLIADLGLVRAAWSYALLEQALSEETEQINLDAIRAALGQQH